MRKCSLPMEIASLSLNKLLLEKNRKLIPASLSFLRTVLLRDRRNHPHRILFNLLNLVNVLKSPVQW